MFDKKNDNSKDKKSSSSNAKDGSLVAKKDFVINHNEYQRKIKEGEDLSDVPEMYHPNLKTEQVI